MKDILELYLAFLRIGAVNFGGGYAMLPLLERDLVQDRGGTTTQDLTDYFAIGQCTPGLIALNVATFIGSRRKGVAGAIAATLGFITIPIIIILIIALFLKNFRNNKYVNNAFYGLRPASMGLIATAGITVVASTLFDSGKSVNWIGLALAVILWIFTNKVKKTKGLHPIVFIGVSAVIGIIFHM